MIRTQNKVPLIVGNSHFAQHEGVSLVHSYESISTPSTDPLQISVAVALCLLIRNSHLAAMRGSICTLQCIICCVVVLVVISGRP